ncbi:putative non-ribosomal peptide synthetase [Gordonia hirsuta DSM 44140 = NBRC 16056]|uniref:Putative non-ribosomal peptide synthetase n=1 Tax=Gordonia hirsuta DSM 44140 = NBRC 16056 TaxID=1121927 RepID=L7LAE5_9ACTN|nr:Pls/PosA family non-ribosomal peptide synthetase [Gordonia hirsuta]GAC57022.1 putative non-ribosomal peptide synthetase [Gordonia hirsuta DSM 44140 = NBRC 16056]
MPIPREFLLADAATPPRTLVDILLSTAAAHPDAPAIDDGDQVLTYDELVAVVRRLAGRLGAEGIGPGDRIGIRMPSGHRDLYIAILATLYAGAAYVPVDADDPDERAQLVFGEAQVDAIIDGAGIHARAGRHRALGSGAPLNQSPAHLNDDAWIIFTSGSTGTPKGVAVTHRNAAAFVDAEALLFLQDAPLGPGDRVLAGLSVAFDASCEEMWLAWRNGACLVPAPRALVRSGMDLGPWLVMRDVNVVSTVPTLAALWPAEALEAVRLLIFGGEACPPELADRLATGDREVWNTYGPTEATVVASAAQMRRGEPVRIGLPLAGWDLAVVDADGQPVPIGQTGELVIGGVGLARYLDPAKDAEKYAPLESLGWDRAYRSGDVVRLDRAGLLFVGRADDQVKIGGRRIELGEIDNALQNLPGVSGGACAVRKNAAGNAMLIGYVASTDSAFDLTAAQHRLRDELPAAMVPRLVLLDDLPTRTSGKVDRDALPWPVPGAESPAAPDGAPADELTPTQAWLAAQWTEVLGMPVHSADADFFTEGGGSLAAAQLVSALRTRHPEITVAELYDHPRLGSLAELLDSLAPPAQVSVREVTPIPPWTGMVQTAAALPLATLTGVAWMTWLGVANNIGRIVADALGYPAPWLVAIPWWLLAVAFGLFVTPFGRLLIAAGGARLLLSNVRPGAYPRGGSMHLRLWTAERLMEASGVHNMSGAPWMPVLARALGGTVGKGVDLHSLPPVTGLLTIGDLAAIEPEVDLSGWWLDGDVLQVGTIEIKSAATVGARSVLLPGAVVGRGAVVDPGSTVLHKVKARQHWAGSPATRIGKAPSRGPADPPPARRGWVPVYALSALLIAGIPLLALAAGLVVTFSWALGAGDLGTAALRALALSPAGVLAALAAFALCTLLVVRLASIGLAPGWYPVRSRIGWQMWLTERVMDSARTYLFPLYASLLTPWWFRALGARIGKGAEISTALVVPKFTVVGDDSFLADDTMVASYELRRGWMRIGQARVGKRAFLGNSGMVAPARKVPKGGLVAVLSAAPEKAKSGSSWLGSPPQRLRRTAETTDDARTFAPSLRLRIARSVVETLRLTAVWTSFVIGTGVLLALQWVATAQNAAVATAVSGLILLAAGIVAGIVAAAAKWLVIGRVRAGEHPLWSSFIWRNELSDAFVETVAAPWFANAATGTPVLNLWLRALGARIGRGVWCESYWLPEADLVELGDGANVQRGCVVQTHLFHDRVMAIDAVIVEPGATLGPHSVALPAARLGQAATVGPGSLVMRGDHVPAHTRWQGNPIAPWPR